jgi:zinc transport system ATP-binding protein
MTDHLVSIHDLHVTLGGNPVLRGVNARLAHGKVTALIGLNGSGKTTLLRALLGEVAAEAGRIEFHCGHDHSRPSPEHIGYVPQRLQIDARWPLTVRDLLGLALQKRPIFLGIGRKTRGLMDQMLAGVGAPHLLDRPVEKISGGELQRVLLALALRPQPELLLLDEPAAGIDFKTQKNFYELLGSLNRKTKMTILLVSHDVSMVSQYAQHVLCLGDGRIQCEGPPRDVLTGEVLAKTFGAQVGFYGHHDHGRGAKGARPILRPFVQPTFCTASLSGGHSLSRPSSSIWRTWDSVISNCFMTCCRDCDTLMMPMSWVVTRA